MAGPVEKLHQSRQRSIALYAVTALCVIGVPQLIYGLVLILHHDLAGLYLSGLLANILGAWFDNYSLYFPPAERAWFSLAARAAGMSGMRPDLMVMLMSSLSVLISVMLAYRIRRETVGATPLFLILPAIVLVLLPIAFKSIFGLREHMVALGLWPYLVLRLSDPEGLRIGRTTRCFLGLWLGTMLLFKYLYAVVVLLVELVDAAIQRRPFLLFRIENLVAGTIVALYLLLWLGIHPDQREVIGMMKSGIDANLLPAGTNWLMILYRLPAVFLFFALAWLSRRSLRETLIGFALVSGALAAAAIQSRWYTHHVFPITLAYIAWWWILGAGFRWWGHVVVAMLVAAPLLIQYKDITPYQRDYRELDSAMLQAGISVAGKKVGMLSVHPSPYSQYLMLHRASRWNASVNNSYVASELLDYDRIENLGKIPPPVRLEDPGRRALHEEMMKLWLDMPPDAMLLDQGMNWPLRYVEIDWTKAFANDPRFAELLSRYEPVLVHSGKRMQFTYYVRKGD